MGESAQDGQRIRYRVAKRLSYQIAYSGITVVSGLARGIDTPPPPSRSTCGKGANNRGARTGLHYIYPAENRDLAEKISTSGAIVTEFPMDTTPDRQTKPLRIDYQRKGFGLYPEWCPSEIP